jgi:hypothetical protein
MCARMEALRQDLRPKHKTDNNGSDDDGDDDNEGASLAAAP